MFDMFDLLTEDGIYIPREVHDFFYFWYWDCYQQELAAAEQEEDFDWGYWKDAVPPDWMSEADAEESVEDPSWITPSFFLL
jgi:hypothetical protein